MFRLPNPLKRRGFLANPAAGNDYVLGVSVSRLESACVVNYPPLGLIGTSVPVEGQMKRDSREAPLVHYWIVSPEYFHTVGLRLRRGGSSIEDTD